MNKKDIPADLYAEMQASIPILCIDVLCLNSMPDRERKLGLIYRETPHQGDRWCLVGGRVGLNEPITVAVTREIGDALGVEVVCSWTPTNIPIYIAEYFSQKVSGCLFDPRQHAVGLTFIIEISGPIQAQGEAKAFRWFDLNSLPSSDEFGFGQDRVVEECIRRLGFHS